MELKQLKMITILSVLLALSLSAASISGAFIPRTYVRETASMAAQGAGQDLVDLFLVVPLLLLSLIFVRKNSRAAYLIFGGTVFYIMYSFIIYSFGVHFNFLFLLYCIILGLSLYIFILLVVDVSGLDVENWFSPKSPSRFLSFYLIFVAAMFYIIWLKELVPAIINNTIPQAVADYNLLVNPVHVIDIAFALPGLVVAALLLIRKQRLGYILAPISLVFIIILSIALAGMAVMMMIRDIGGDMSLAGIFIVLALFSTVLLILFLKNLKKPSNI